ncbi:MAG TPA: iron dicitrate transport regulator FecR, partial [Dyadobacter sp.]|nr:iron dicitrate transport regulator FecR [Dyadobacter sp.]
MKTNPSHSMDDLLVKCILDEANAEERETVNTWRTEHPENEKYYTHFKLIWQQSRELASTSNVNENEAWQRFKKRTSERETPVVELNSHNKNYFIQIAAAIVVLAGIGWAVYFSMFRSASTELVTMKAGREALTDTLPD